MAWHRFQDLAQIIKGNLMPLFAPESHYRHAIFLQRRGVPEVLIKEIFEFAGINLFLHTAARSVADGYKVVEKIPSYYPIIAYDRRVLRQYSQQFHTADGTFD